MNGSIEKTNNNELKSERLQLRCTAKEKETIQKMADDAYMKLSQYIIQVLLYNYLLNNE